MKNRIISVHNNTTRPQGLTILATDGQPAGKGIVLLSSFIIPSGMDSIRSGQTRLMVGATEATFERDQLIDTYLLQARVDIAFTWLGNISVIFQPDYRFELRF